MKKPIPPRLLLSLFFLISCQFGLIEPERNLEIIIQTNAKEVDVLLYTLPDSTKRYNGTYQLRYFPEGKINLKKIPNGFYWLRVQESENATNALDSTFYYKDTKRIQMKLAV